MTAKVAPVVLEKEGKPKPPSPEVRRKAKEIVEESGANSKQHFNRVAFGEVTFRKQAEVYLRWAKTRDREPTRDTSSIEAALNKWILPSIGDLWLANCYFTATTRNNRRFLDGVAHRVGKSGTPLKAK